MKDIESRVILLKDEELQQGFGDDKPYFSVKIADCDYPEILNVDSFPCYHHNRDLVVELAAKCEKIFPINPKPHYIIVPFEGVCRTNGQASHSHLYRDGESISYPYIVLWGKRTVPGLMTTYLVGHEITHNIESFICRKRGFEANTFKFREEYAKMRGVEANYNYGARRWHTNIGEIIANDGRICCFNIEPNFWPHDCEHPKNLLHVNQFWSDLMMEYSNS